MSQSPNPPASGHRSNEAEVIAIVRRLCQQGILNPRTSERERERLLAKLVSVEAYGLRG